MIAIAAWGGTAAAAAWQRKDLPPAVQKTVQDQTKGAVTEVEEEAQIGSIPAAARAAIEKKAAGGRSARWRS